MRIAICDDEQIFIDQLHNHLWAQEDCSVDCFLSPLALLEKYKAGIFYDVVFLDIEMAPMDGLTLAGKIRTLDKNTVIIFLTSHAEYAPDGYEVRAFRYLMKPITSQALQKVMRDLRSALPEHDKIILKMPECELLLSLKDIFCIEAVNKDCVIRCEGEELTVRRSLTELEEMLPAASFCRIHRKYLVNLAHVREFDETRLTLDCGLTLPVSRRRSTAFRKALEQYIDGGFV